MNVLTTTDTLQSPGYVTTSFSQVHIYSSINPQMPSICVYPSQQDTKICFKSV